VTPYVKLSAEISEAFGGRCCYVRRVVGGDFRGSGNELPLYPWSL